MLLLLTITAAVEAIAGVALFTVPAFSAPLVLGGTLDSATGVAVSRLAGAALIALAIICWHARRESSNATGIVAAMLFYNLAVVALLIYVGLGEGIFAIFLWPAVVLHAVLAGWCIACLRPVGGYTKNDKTTV